MISNDHPYFFLQQLFDRAEATFHFSRYVYTPDSLFDEREELEVNGADISIEWIETQIGKLKSNQEFAIHSKVTVDGRTWHIPMLDLVVSRIEHKQLSRIQVFMPRRVFSTSAFYHSGRSFHIYSTCLLRPQDWHEFLGRALLINPRDDGEIVDSRWIGHRLIAGYCSLRLSNNSHQYHGMPRRIGVSHLGDYERSAPLHT